MNQQRSRRFRAAREAERKQEEETGKEGDEGEGRVVEKDSAFDSNVITPGTPFMQLVSESLRNYIRSRLTDNSSWSGLKVILWIGLSR